jgi:hypothetical protein
MKQKAETKSIKIKADVHRRLRVHVAGTNEQIGGAAENAILAYISHKIKSSRKKQ